MDDNEPIPEEAQEPMDNFNVALAEFEQVLDEYISVPVDEQQERCPLEKARAELTTLFAVNSLYWTLQAAVGKEPKEDEALAIELSRAKEYMARVEKFDDSVQRPRINEHVAKALVRNALFDVSGGSAAGGEKGADTSMTAQEERGRTTDEDADDAVEIVNEQPATTTSRAPTYASVVAGRGTSVRRQQPKRTVFASSSNSSSYSTNSDESGGEGDARNDQNEEADLMIIDTKGVKGSSAFAGAKRKRAGGKYLLRSSSSKTAPTEAVIDISDDDDDADDDGETAKKRTKTAGGGRN